MRDAYVLNKIRSHDKHTYSSHHHPKHWSDQKEESGESKIK